MRAKWLVHGAKWLVLGHERPFCSQFAADLQGSGVKRGYTGGVLIIWQAVGWRAVWLAGWGMAGGVWRGEDAGHSDRQKNTPEQGIALAEDRATTGSNNCRGLKQC